MATVELTGQNFESVVGGADMVLVDFWASWCGPCRMFAPVFDRASEKYADAVFGKVDTDAETELAQQFNISSIPTLMVIRDNIVLYAQPGALPEQALEELITKARELDMDEVRASIAQDQHGHSHDARARAQRQPGLTQPERARRPPGRRARRITPLSGPRPRAISRPLNPGAVYAGKVGVAWSPPLCQDKPGPRRPAQADSQAGLAADRATYTALIGRTERGYHHA